jgi:hypothetical protein
MKSLSASRSPQPVSNASRSNVYGAAGAPLGSNGSMVRWCTMRFRYFSNNETNDSRSMRSIQRGRAIGGSGSGPSVFTRPR